MFPDTFNPIFVLCTQQVVSRLQKTWVAFLITYFLAICFIVFVYPYFGRFQLSELRYFANLMACVFGVMPGAALAQNQIDKDLSHFTPMTDRQLINGYVLAGLFLSCFLLLLGVPLEIYDVLSGGSVWENCRIFLQGICCAMIVNLFVMSFMTGVRTKVQFTATVFLIYALLVVPLMTYAIGYIPHHLWTIYIDHYKVFYNEFHASSYVYWILAFPSLGVVSYKLAIYNYRLKMALFSKHCVIIGIYLVLLAAFVFLSILLFGLIEYIPAENEMWT